MCVHELICVCVRELMCVHVHALICVCVCVCELMFSLNNIGYFSTCLLKRFTGLSRRPNHRTAVCADFCGKWSFQQARCFPAA